ncbi:MAG: Major facilitator transporter [Herbaspirillum sp.]|nr:Major facilitator transporter [Herbaspirillum sp.]
MSAALDNSAQAAKTSEGINQTGSVKKVMPADGLNTPQRHWAVLAILLGTFMANLDAAIANIAMPVISRDLLSSAATAVWVVNAYQLAVGIAVLPLAALGELFGYKRIYLTGIVVFILGSVACVMSSTMAELIASRALQGLGGACVATMAPALIRSVFPHKIAGRGIAWLALIVAVSSTVGPTVAAAILHLGDWRWLFGINLPIGVGVFAVAIIAVPSNEGIARPFDLGGAIFSAATLALLILGVGGLGAASGHVDQRAVIEIGAAIVMGAILFFHQRRSAAPMVPLDLLRIPVFSMSVLTSICSYAAQSLAFISLPFLLEHQLARSPAITGLLITPWPFVIVFVAPLAGRLSDRYPAGILCSIGLVALAIGLALTALLPADPSNLQIAWRLALCGIGFGFFQTPNNRVLLTSGPRERGGAASGMMTMARLIGMTLGAVFAAVLFEISPEHGTVMALTAGSMIAVGGVVASSLRLRTPKLNVLTS